MSAIKSGTECFCFDEFPTEHVKPTKDVCDIPCPGDEHRLCGGLETFHFYIASKWGGYLISFSWCGWGSLGVRLNILEVPDVICTFS